MKLKVIVEQVPAELAPNLGCLLYALQQAEDLAHAANLVNEGALFKAYKGGNHVAVHQVAVRARKDGEFYEGEGDRLLLITLN